jgi:hypothetical protein
LGVLTYVNRDPAAQRRAQQLNTKTPSSIPICGRSSSGGPGYLTR